MTDSCANCAHPVNAHDGEGCLYGRHTPHSCSCLFEPEVARALVPAGGPRCLEVHRVGGTAYRCTGEAGHGDVHIAAGISGEAFEWGDGPPCQATHVLSLIVYRCSLREGHPFPHRANGTGDQGDFCWTEEVATYPDRWGELSDSRSTQVGGSHYEKFTIQPWDIIDEYHLSFYAGNVLKYLLRAGHKGPALEDLKKARHYLDRVIEIEKGK